MPIITGDALVENGANYGHRAVLSNGAIVIKPAISASWNKVRIGARYSLQYTGGYAFYGARLVLGMCSGTSPFTQDSSATHFFGAGFNGSAAWTENLDSYSMSTLRIVSQYGGSTNWHATNIGTFGGQMQGNGYDKRTGILIDIDRTSGSPYTVQIQKMNAANGVLDFDDASWDTSRLSSTFVARTNYSTSSPYTHPCDEGTYGALDHVCLFWNQNYMHLYVEDICINVIS